MSGVRHTPGPWHVEHDTEVIASDEDMRIAWADGRSMRLAGGEAAANARLIAAAPEMLEALEAVLHDHVEGRKVGNSQERMALWDHPPKKDNRSSRQGPPGRPHGPPKSWPYNEGTAPPAGGNRRKLPTPRDPRVFIPLHPGRGNPRTFSARGHAGNPLPVAPTRKPEKTPSWPPLL